MPLTASAAPGSGASANRIDGIGDIASGLLGGLATGLGGGLGLFATGLGWRVGLAASGLGLFATGLGRGLRLTDRDLDLAAVLPWHAHLDTARFHRGAVLAGADLDTARLDRRAALAGADLGERRLDRDTVGALGCWGRSVRAQGPERRPVLSR